ncbi:MAG: hypothetical protein H6735_27825 [Alphaproteobacteria bacterium]|nr:hypothetical protein [Alphaproteobacteria bacterium]
MSPLLLAVPLVVLDFDSSPGPLVEGGDTGQWAWGTPTVGPVGGGRTWATVLDGPYLHDTLDWLELPTGSLAGATRPTLELRHWYAMDAGDAGLLEVDRGSGWEPFAPYGGYPDPAGFSGASNGWIDSFWDLSGLTAGTRLRLAFRADAAVADDGWYLSRLRVLDGDALAPSIAPATVPTDTQDLDGPYVVALDVTDDVGVTGVSVWWSADGGAEQEAVATLVSGDRYRAEIPGRAPDTVVRWRAEATDGENVAAWPPSGTDDFRVFLAAPTDLAADLPARPVTQWLPLSWTTPVSPHAVARYELVQDGTRTTSTAATAVTVPAEAELDGRFVVRAVYDIDGTEVAGDDSAQLDLTYEVPAIDPLDPEQVWQGDQVRLRVEGVSLYLVQGASTLACGEGIDVLLTDIVDAGTAEVLVQVDEEAALGPRDLTVDGPVGRFVFEDALTVGDDLDAPRIARVEPASLPQGAEAPIELQATVPFAGPVTVTVDEDLLVTSEPEVDGDLATVSLAASTFARVGAHTLVLDDGRRLWSTTIFVEEVVLGLPEGCGGCASTRPGVAVGWLAAGLSAAAGRRASRRRRCAPAAKAR